MERFNLILAAADDFLTKPLEKFSLGATDIINIVLVSLAGLGSIGIIVYMLVQVAKKNSDDPPIAEAAGKKLKIAIKSCVVGVVIFTVGFALVNSVAMSMAEGGFEVESGLIKYEALKCSLPSLGTENCISQVDAVVCGARQVWG